MSNDVLLDDRGVTVTTTKAIIAGTTYPIAGITSVRTVRKAASAPLPILPIACFSLGLFALLITLVSGMSAFSEGYENRTEAFVGALFSLFVGLGLFWLGTKASPTKLPPARHIVTLGTAGGERQALTTTDEAFATAVRAAIEEAITRRG